MNYVEPLLILASTFTGCVSVSVFASVFASVFGILVGITSSAVGLKICVITTGIKKYKGIVKEKKKKTWWNSIFNKKYAKYNWNPNF